MSYNPQNPNGQATSANSAPVVVASDQSSITVTDSNVATNTSNTATNTNPLTVSSAGGYVRQDSTATIAKESGGNLATVAGAVSSSKMQVVANPVTSGGLSVASSAIKATATSVKGSAGQVYGWFVANNNTAMSYLQFYNVASGSVTVGTTTPLFSIGIPANAGANVSFPIGIPFSTAISVAATTTFTGSGAPTNNVEYNIFYS